METQLQEIARHNLRFVGKDPNSGFFLRSLLRHALELKENGIYDTGVPHMGIQNNTTLFTAPESLDTIIEHISALFETPAEEKQGGRRSERRNSHRENFYERQAIERARELDFDNDRRTRSHTVKINKRAQQIQQNREDREIEKLEQWFEFMKQKLTKAEDKEDCIKELEKERKVVSLATCEVIRLISLSAAEKARFMEKLWGEWNRVNVALVAEYIKQKERRADELARKLRTFKRKLIANNEERIVELNALQRVADNMKAKCLDRTKELASARQQIYSMERYQQSLNEGQDKLKSKLALLQKVHFAHCSEPNRKLCQTLQCQFCQITQQKQHDQNTLSREIKLQVSAGENEDDNQDIGIGTQKMNLSGLPISVKLCNVQCQTQKLQRYQRAVQCMLSDFNDPAEMKFPGPFQEEVTKELPQEQIHFLMKQQQTMIGENSPRRNNRYSMFELKSKETLIQRDEMHSWKKSNSKFLSGQESARPEEDENKKKSKVVSKLSTPKRQLFKRDQELRANREKAKANRKERVKIHKEFEKVRRMTSKGISKFPTSGSNYSSFSPVRNSAPRGYSYLPIESEPVLYYSDQEREKKKMMLRREERKIEDDMVLECLLPIYTHRRGETKMRSRLLFLNNSMQQLSNDAPPTSGISSSSHLNQRRLMSPVKRPLSQLFAMFDRVERGQESLGLNFKISLHPVHQYTHRQYGRLLANDLQGIEIQRQPMNEKWLAKTITRIYQEFSQMYKSSLMKASELFTLRLSLSQQLFDSIHQKYGLQSVTEEKFEAILAAVLKFNKYPRVKLFGHFLGVFSFYPKHQFRFYLLALQHLLSTGDIGVAVQNPEHQLVHYTPLSKAEQFVALHFKKLLNRSNYTKLLQAIRAIKITNPASLDLLDIDRLLFLLLSVRRQVNFPKIPSLEAIFQAVDFDDNECLPLNSWLLLARHIEPCQLNCAEAERVFFQNAYVMNHRLSQLSNQIEEEDIEVLSYDVFLTLCQKSNLFSKVAQFKFLEIEEGEDQILNLRISRLHENYDARAFQLIQRLEIVGYETWSLRRYLLLLQPALSDPIHSYQALLSFTLLQNESYLCVRKNELQTLIGPLRIFTTLDDPQPSRKYSQNRTVLSSSSSPGRRKSCTAFFSPTSANNKLSRIEKIKTLFRSQTLNRASLPSAAFQSEGSNDLFNSLNKSGTSLSPKKNEIIRVDAQIKLKSDTKDLHVLHEEEDKISDTDPL